MSTSENAPPPRPSSPPARSASPVARGAGSSGWLRLTLKAAAWVLGLFGAGVAAVLGLVLLSLVLAYPNLPDINSLADYRPKLPLRVVSSDGVQLGEFGAERREFVPIAQIPQVMKDALIAAEDARFYEHGGVDYKGILRAAIDNLREWRRVGGGSTITMQVARNFYLSTEKTFTRKIYEILLTLKIESRLSKGQILELYMNQIYLGQRANGFAAASEIYFGKRLKDVTVAEAAMLAGLPNAPSAYNPIVNPRRATLRQHYVIERMYENGLITEKQHDQALAQKLSYRTQTENAAHAEFVAEMARQLVYAQYGDDAYTRGLVVHLTVSAADQLVAYNALREGLMNYELRQVYRGPEAYVDLPADPAQLDLRVAEALADHPDNGDLHAAVVLEASPRKVVAMLQSGDTVTVTGNGLKPVTSGLSSKAGPKIEIRPGAVVRALQNGKGDWSLTQVPAVEGALVAMNPNTGALRALVGGFDFGKNKFNHATQAWRQPGSSFKPFIYSAALEKGFTPATVVNDAPLFFDAGETGSQPWEPKNYDGRFDGPMPLQTGLAKSKNMVSIRVLRSIGTDFAQEWISHFGFDAARHPAYLTMALGAGAATPLQMVEAYSVFANGGYLVAPRLIERISDSKGKTLLKTEAPVLDDARRTLPARNAFVMGTMLNEVARSGTAARAQALLKRPDIYGKTGTTNDSLDAWFAGYQPDMVAVVWIGYDTPKKLGDRETGGTIALPVWIDWMQYALKGVPVRQPSAPEGVVQVGPYWMYEEFTGGGGIASIGLDEKIPEAATTEERSSILDLFKR